ncbi:MAG: DUF3054 domain-containing protein [Anaerolineae bacterium]|nr:DUF3054 domain-containing protein [Anaerolineae bacterium]
MLTDNNFEKRPTPPLSLRMAGLFPNPLAALYMMLGDIVTLLLFVYIGQADHELIDAENPVRGLLLASLPFIITWLVTSTVLGAYRVSAEDLRWRVAFWRLLNAWLVAAPLGIVLRAVWLDRAVIPTAFVLAALGFGGLMLLIWRAAYILVWRSRHQGRQQVG